MSQFRFARISLILAALGLNAVPTLLTSAHAQAAPPAAAAKSDSVRAEIFKLLDPAKVNPMLAAKQYAELRANITASEAFASLTPYEVYVINRNKLALGHATGNNPMAIAALEQVISSGRLDAKEKLDFIEALGGTYYNAKNFPKAIEMFKLHQKESGMPEKTRPVLTRIYIESEDFASAKVELENTIAAADKAGTKPSMNDLHLLAASADKLKDTALYAATLDRLITLYPSEKYWNDALRRMTRKPGFADRLRLDAYRLRMDTVKVMEETQYLDMAERAMQIAYFVEAKQVMDAGFAAGKLGTGKDAAEHKQIQSKANKGAAEDTKTIDASEAGAHKPKTGTPLVNLGYTYVTMGQFDKGIDLMNKGIAKGGLKNPEDAKLRLGVAYAKAGKKDEALKIFQTIKGTDGTAELARYWTMHVNAPAVAAAPAPAK